VHVDILELIAATSTSMPVCDVVGGTVGICRLLTTYYLVLIRCVRGRSLRSQRIGARAALRPLGPRIDVAQIIRDE
jgi:hypothetical protein